MQHGPQAAPKGQAKPPAAGHDAQAAPKMQKTPADKSMAGKPCVKNK